jgi:hypothetical protein
MKAKPKPLLTTPATLSASANWSKLALQTFLSSFPTLTISG